MTPPFWLIAEREFRAYAATVSFWIALAVGPLVMAGALAAAGLASHAAQVPTVAIQADNAALARDGAAALIEAARTENRAILLAKPGEAAKAASLLVLTAARDGAPLTRFIGAAPLSAAGQALVARTVERDGALRRLGAPTPTQTPLPPAKPAAQPTARDAAPLTRFSLVMMLWLTLTGSLGMLLQAVVRERANRGLESLLAAARPWEIVFGKLVGVGCVSLLVLGAWLGAAIAMAPMTPSAGGLMSAVLQGLADPAAVLRAMVIYALAFAFYGLATVAVGAAARDTAAAQNLSRPMFAVLLAAFFAALTASLGGAAQLSWLVYAPPFTPFMLLLHPPGELSFGAQASALGLLALATLGAGRCAVRGLALSPRRVTIWSAPRSR